MVDVLRETFPDARHDASFQLINGIKVNYGEANAGDVVSCIINDCRYLGELLLSVVITDRGSDTTCSLIAIWDIQSEHPVWPTFAVSDRRVVKVPLDCLDFVHTYSMSLDRKTCLVFDPASS